MYSTFNQCSNAQSPVSQQSLRVL